MLHWFKKKKVNLEGNFYWYFFDGESDYFFDGESDYWYFFDGESDRANGRPAFGCGLQVL